MLTQAKNITGSQERPVEPAYAPRRIRETILRMAHYGATVHVACAFSIVELLAVLYRNHLQLEGKQPGSPDRHYMVLSKGHGVMALYACLHELGWLTDADIADYFKNGTRLKGLGDAHVPGVEVTAGSLGHGLSVGVGLALAARRRASGQKCYVLVGDGEMNEGAIWEALLFAAHHQLDNLCVIVDENRYQAMGTTDEVMALGDLGKKFTAFGFDCETIDGHDEAAIDESLTRLMAMQNGRPKAIVARTVKGKGVSFMEGDNIWHYTRIDAETFDRAMKELDSDQGPEPA